MGGGGCARERGTAGAHSPAQVKGMRAGGAPTPLDFPAWAGVADFGDVRWVGWGKARERSTPAASKVAEVVTPADASLAGLEESPRFTPRARLLQWGAPHPRPHPPSLPAQLPARLHRAGGGRRVSENLYLGLRRFWPEGDPGVRVRLGPLSLRARLRSEPCAGSCTPPSSLPPLGITRALAVNRLTPSLQDCEERNPAEGEAAASQPPSVLPFPFSARALPSPHSAACERGPWRPRPDPKPPRWRSEAPPPPQENSRPQPAAAVSCSDHVLPAPRTPWSGGSGPSGGPCLSCPGPNLRALALSCLPDLGGNRFPAAPCPDLGLAHSLS